MKKKVLQLIGSFHMGGSERQAVALTRSLLGDGAFDVSLATLNNEGVLLPEVERLGFTVVPEFRLTSFYNLGFVRQVRRFARFLKENQIDLVQTHDFYTNVFGMAAARLAGVTSKIAAKRETLGLRSSAQEYVEKCAFSFSDAIVANSIAVKDHLIELSVTENKIEVIYNGLNLAEFETVRDDDATRKQFALPAEAPLMTLVANLRHRVKDVPMFLRAAKKISQSHGNVRFVIAGEGELENELKAFSSRLGIADRVYFIGRCTNVAALLSASNVCVLTSTAEGFSNSIIEYMAAAKPVIATDVGGAAEAIIEGETGYLVPAGDDSAMAGYAIDLFDDPAKAVGMGVKGRLVAMDRFSVANQLSKTLELYDRCLAK